MSINIFSLLQKEVSKLWYEICEDERVYDKFINDKNSDELSLDETSLDNQSFNNPSFKLDTNTTNTSYEICC